MKLAIHHIARRAKINCSEEELLTWVQDNEKLWTPGDKPGIFHCSIPANWVQEANPRELNTLLHDIFGMSGGTPTSGSAEEKLELIRKSFLFWKDKVLVAG